MKKRGRGGNTNRSGKPLEYVLEQLAHYGFQIIQGVAIKKFEIIPKRFVHTHSPYTTIYHTRGFHEGLIVANEQNDTDFIETPGGRRIQIIVECKFQGGSGSTDEKVPYIIKSFIKSDIPNWIWLTDGPFWLKSKRGQAGVAYGKREAQELSSEQRRLLVLTRHEFRELVMKAWGNRNG